MQIKSHWSEDLELQALYESGTDVSYAGEVIDFLEGERTLMFSIDDLTPTYATFSKIVTGAQSQSVKLGTAYGSSAVQFPAEDALVRRAIKFLADRRGVRFIAIYDGPSGGYKQIPVNELV